MPYILQVPIYSYILEKWKHFLFCMSYLWFLTPKLSSLKQPAFSISYNFWRSGIWEQFVWMFLELVVSDDSAVSCWLGCCLQKAWMGRRTHLAVGERPQLHTMWISPQGCTLHHIAAGFSQNKWSGVGRWRDPEREWECIITLIKMEARVFYHLISEVIAHAFSVNHFLCNLLVTQTHSDTMWPRSAWGCDYQEAGPTWELAILLLKSECPLVSLNCYQKIHRYFVWAR